MLDFMRPFEKKQTAPTSDPHAGSLFSVRFNGDWLPLVLGALFVLWDGALWLGDEQAVLDAQILASQILRIYPVIGADSMIGTVFAFIGASAPENCLLCDGAEYLRVDYPDLYALLPDALIVDADHFITPDMRGRTVRGGDTNWPIGNSGGEDTVQLEVGNLPAHSHAISDHAHGIADHAHTMFVSNDRVVVQSGAGQAVGTEPVQSATDLEPLVTMEEPLTAEDTGGNDGHENWPPWYAITWCVVARL